VAEVRPVGLQDPSEIERRTIEFARGPNGGLIVSPNGLAIVHRELIINLAARYKLPARNGAPDARGASAWSSADTASVVAATRATSE